MNSFKSVHETGILIAPTNTAGSIAKAPAFTYLFEAPTVHFTQQSGLVICTAYASKIETPEQYKFSSLGAETS
jgi:hypothetical protein